MVEQTFFPSPTGRRENSNGHVKGGRRRGKIQLFTIIPYSKKPERLGLNKSAVDVFLFLFSQIYTEYIGRFKRESE